ncbi:MAG TPA: chromosome segregation protein SMC, partial [Beijerinckiaceae bacterium]
RSREEAAEAHAQAAEALEGLPQSPALQTKLDRARASAAHARAEAAEARAAVQALGREAQIRAQRRQAIAAERVSWDERRARATRQIAEFEERVAEAREEQTELAEAPDLFLQRRRALMQEIEDAEQARKDASDRRAEAETRLAESDRIARQALDAMSAVREERARAESRLEGLRQRREDVARAIAQDLECEPSALADLAGVEPGRALPDLAVVEKRLDDLKSDRERLGAVNLRADDELTEIETRRDAMAAERDDLTEAIRKLRVAIQNLNKEGRERLAAAFDVVNGHFKELFTTLFGGGAAELQLVESDDPLEAGLEILARPPGKKPQTMTLLSGGEQALTAMSLIFAVFLTNPSPICVLDEVDAPLDDANVERFCDLLDEMRKKTDTRFVTITHNPITMARMDRLFGVTMAERGVSQLVSVDLGQAERMVEAAE